jgi:hypothetical protein
MTMLTTFKAAGRAAVVALALSATALPATTPAMAQSEPSFSFRLGIGSDGNALSFGLRSGDRDRFVLRDRCLTNRQVVRGLRHHGFRDVDIIRTLSRSRVRVEADWGRRTYRMTVNKCTGEVYNIERVRRFDNDFGLEFRFGN